MAHRKDMPVAQRRRFARRVTELLASLGAEQLPEDWCLSWKLATPVGALWLSVHKKLERKDDYDPSVFGRFDDVDAAKQAGQRVDGLSTDLCGVSLNPYSGKWNHHYWGAWTADEALEDFGRVLRAVLALPPRKEA